MIPGLKSAIILMETKARSYESFSQDGNDFYKCLAGYQHWKKTKRQEGK